MKYAVVKIGGSQYKVAEGDEIEVERIEKWELRSGNWEEVKKGTKIEIKDVLLVVDKDKVNIGQPFVKGARVKAEILDQVKGKKIRIATYRAKSRYRRVKGHRKLLTRLKIEKIV